MIVQSSMLPPNVHKCAVPPDHLRSETSSRTCNIPKLWRSTKTQK